eukprot:2050316-Amphidinium_carterae.1
MASAANQKPSSHQCLTSALMMFAFSKADLSSAFTKKSTISATPLLAGKRFDKSSISSLPRVTRLGAQGSVM